MSFNRLFFIVATMLSLHVHAYSFMQEVGFGEEGEPQAIVADPEVQRNVFLSLLTRAETADQLAALDTQMPQPAPQPAPAVNDQRRGLKSTYSDNGGAGTVYGDGLVVSLVVALVVWFLSFRR